MVWENTMPDSADHNSSAVLRKAPDHGYIYIYIYRVGVDEMNIDTRLPRDAVLILILNKN